MGHALEGARLKVVRAQEHLKALQAELDSFFQTHDHTFVTHRKGDQIAVEALGVLDIPQRFGLLIGDAAANLRTALDYVLWELAVRFFDPACDISDHEDRRLTTFPIATSATDHGYRDRLNRLEKRKIPTAAIDVIKSVQPHVAGYEPMGWLHHLVNQDKHRSLTGILAFIVEARIAFRQGDSEFLSDRAGIVGGGATFKTPPDVTAALDRGEMQMQVQASALVTFSDVAMPLEPVERTMWQITQTVSEVIPRFLDLFG